MNSQFGAKTDHFGILADGEGTLGDVLEIIDSSATPDAQSRADADENGDIAAATWHGNTDGALTRSVEYICTKRRIARHGKIGGW